MVGPTRIPAPRAHDVAVEVAVLEVARMKVGVQPVEVGGGQSPAVTVGMQVLLHLLQSSIAQEVGEGLPLQLTDRPASARVLAPSGGRLSLFPGHIEVTR